jgi:ethanolamine utilization protein EutA
MKMTGCLREMLSVGIDVGTTTTQVVFSRLKVRDTARLGLVPRIEIDARSVEYVGPAQLTPRSGPDLIDADRLYEMVRDEYAAAGVAAEEVETGAVIITGEAALRQNADAVLATLSGLAGDFVVTVAGPNLEAQIAARGSGAAAWSADNYTTIANVDIGGGSSNVAVFRSGRHLASSAIMVGGRCVELEPTSGMVTAVTPSGEQVLRSIGSRLQVGAEADLGSLRTLSDRLAALIVDLVLGQSSPLLDELRLSPALDDGSTVAAVSLSGGVGRCYYEHTPADTIDEIALYGDIGPLLARSLHTEPRLRTMPVRVPEETLSATVIGAASQTVTISGTTIWVRADLLPLRDLPVVEPHMGRSFETPGYLAEAVRAAARRWDAEGDGRVAVALHLPDTLDFADLSAIASALADYASDSLPSGAPLVVVTQEDYAQVLGQTVQAMRPGLPLITIDQIGLGEGDFIDIGRPLLDGRAVPVSVKTLVFSR